MAGRTSVLCRVRRHQMEVGVDWRRVDMERGERRVEMGEVDMERVENREAYLQVQARGFRGKPNRSAIVWICSG